MKLLIIFLLIILSIPFINYLYRHLKFLKKIKLQRSIIHSFDAFDKLKKGDFSVPGLEYPLIFASSLTSFLVFLTGLGLLFFIIAASSGICLDINMDVQANIIFNMIFAIFSLVFIIYLLQISTVIILDKEEFKINSHLKDFISFGRLRRYSYDEIDGIDIRLIFGKHRRGTHSAGIQLAVNTKKGAFKIMPNILYNNETLFLIAGLKEKLGSKINIVKE